MDPHDLMSSPSSSRRRGTSLTSDQPDDPRPFARDTPLGPGDDLSEGRLEALFVAEERGGDLAYAGQICFGFARRGLWSELDRLRAGPSRKGVVPIEPVLRADIKFFGRHPGGLIRDGVLLALLPAPVALRLG